ncbi:multidrug effflux MFS transporter [Lacinutrix sp. 5H-3-7-4]|uniref:multidrug effflux MFS transporter n=1 Tax=Lacinutrix sp. (strain 5H-3-7-4) TaxID=983544 RepID=UPI00020A343C|nr:multidrug effflux MFS transporter [Lacinutrix sp. 5H-3-7-4]AEH02605.1 drug resistance transporter, Bcr/CflA subfamily [Lacinutrix sp. 5H-3-7-4]
MMQKQAPIKTEFIALMAALMSLVALTIDALLPALPEIGNSLGVTNPENNQLLITMIFLGIGCGQLVFGPLSDSFGRKPMVYIGFVIFAIASFICVTTESFEMMILGRILQGVGLSSPRTISIAMIRDTYSGDYMAKVLSIVVMFFILVPVIAPTFGQFLLNFSNWKAIFNVNLVIGVLIIFWFWKRQPETLAKHNTIKFSPRIFITGTKEFLKFKPAIAFTLASGFITGSFMVYLSTSQQIFQEQYGLGELFPYFFASTAISVGLSTFLNSRLVVRFGSFKLASVAAFAFFVISVLYVILFWQGINPPVAVLLGFLLVQFFAVGLLFGNLRSLAMEPLGHIAGIGAAINGFVSTVMAVPIANFIGSYVKTSVLPLFLGFMVFGLLTVLVFAYVRRINGVAKTV